MYKYAEKAREQRFSGNHYDGNLTGFCLDNAYVLYHILVNNGYNANIVCGASENYSSDIISKKGLDQINYVEDLEGQVHYWVECDGKHIDIAADIKDRYGDIVISNKLPDSYYLLNNSYKYAKDIISNMPPRCTYCGGKFNYCGCEYEDR